VKRYGPMLAILLLLTGRTAAAQGIPIPPAQGGTVTGVLRSPAGAPAAGVRVAAMTRSESLEDSLKASALVSLTQTDEAGRFRLENIPPGQYYIAAGRVDMPTYYPGTLDTTGRTVVSITAGQTVSGIEFAVLDASRGNAQPGGALDRLNALKQRIDTLRGQRGRGPVPGGAGLAPGVTFGQRTGGGGGRGGRSGLGGRGGPAINASPISPSQPSAAWWTDTALIARLGLSSDQKTKIENIFEQYRQNLLSSRANLEKEEALLARMLDADTIEAKLALPQIDRVTQARGDMEKIYARMTLEMRQCLTRNQWAQLQNEVDLDVANQKQKKQPR
jgi:Spy/CpxP family protein refolding chaperone